MEEQDYLTTYQLEGHNWWFVGTRRIWLEWVRRLRATGSVPRRTEPPRILDVGCGTGINLEALDALGTPVGLDLSPVALGFCDQRGRRALVQGRGELLPFAAGSFDLVTAIGTIEHIAEDREALAEWARVLAPGGQLVLLTSSYRWMWSGHDVSNHHVRRYRTGEIRTMLREAGFESVRASYINCLLFPPIAVVRGGEWLARRGRPPKPHKDTGEVPVAVNRLLTWLLAIEARLLRRTDLPFGVSMVASGVRSGTSSD